MAIEEQKVIDQITVLDSGVVLYREATRIVDDGKVLTQTFHRSSLTPGQDLSGHPDSVVTIAQAAWTPEVVAAYAAHLAEREGSL